MIDQLSVEVAAGYGWSWAWRRSMCQSIQTVLVQHWRPAVPWHPFCGAPEGDDGACLAFGWAIEVGAAGPEIGRRRVADLGVRITSRRVRSKSRRKFQTSPPRSRAPAPARNGDLNGNGLDKESGLPCQMGQEHNLDHLLMTAPLPRA